MNLNIIYFILSLLRMSVCSGYRILAFFPFHGRSHSRVLQPMAKALAAKGHQVDVISHFPLEEPFPNYTDIVQLTDANKYATLDYDTLNSMDKQDDWLHKVLNDTCDHMGHPKIAKLIQDNRKNLKYDLLFLHDLSGFQCLNAIGYLWNVPVITVVTTALYPWMHSFVNDPLNVAISPSYRINTQSKIMTFWERLNNLHKNIDTIFDHYKSSDLQQYYINKYFGNDVPSFLELEKYTALTFINSHYTYTEVKPKSPAVIEVAGIHIQNDSTSMNTNLKKLLDGSKHGFIYFSFGSMVVLESFPHRILEKFYEAFRKIAPVTVIMRVANTSLLPKDTPDNLFTFAWLPQQKILNHPNIKAFISHGGALGTQEALHFAVPMICVPIFAEQNGNCNSLKERNVALTLDYETASPEEVDETIQTIITNSTYKESVRKFSKLFNDRPRSPADEVVYWTEYIIRHGASVLRSPAAELHWWQVELLDLYGFILVCLILAIVFSYFTIRLILKRLSGVTMKVWKTLSYKKIDHMKFD